MLRRLACIGMIIFCMSGVWAQTMTSVDPAKFNQFVVQLKARLEKDGFSKPLVDQAFANVRYIKRAIYKQSHQPEMKLTLDGYLKHMMVPGRISYGRYYMKKHAKLLQAITAKYQVEPQYVVALLGLESSYGRVQGAFPEISALTTLLYDNNRSRYFYKELTYAMKMLQRHDVTPEEMKGSWAGAMGQPQFMPTHYYDYAVDFNHNGRKDIWNDTPDVLASIAYSLHRYGWEYKQPVVIPVTLTRNFKQSLLGWNHIYRAETCLKSGVQLPKGVTVDPKAPVSIVNIGEGKFMIFKNFRILHDWNRSRYYVMAVVELAKLISQPESIDYDKISSMNLIAMVTSPGVVYQ